MTTEKNNVDKNGRPYVLIAGGRYNGKQYMIDQLMKFLEEKHNEKTIDDLQRPSISDISVP